MDENKFWIPLNYKSSQTVFNGFLKLRNCAEGVIIAVIAILLVRCLPLPEDYAISVYILVGGIGWIAGSYGVQGDPLSVHILIFFKWLQRRKPCIYNNHGEVFTTNAADLMLNQTQFRDTLADAVDRIRNKMSANHPVYIEGETFEFSIDPELQALRRADEEYNSKNTMAPSEEVTAFSAETVEQAQPAESSGELDIDQIFDSIVLDEEA